MKVIQSIVYCLVGVCCFSVRLKYVTSAAAKRIPETHEDLSQQPCSVAARGYEDGDCIHQPDLEEDDTTQDQPAGLNPGFGHFGQHANTTVDEGLRNNDTLFDASAAVPGMDTAAGGLRPDPAEDHETFPGCVTAGVSSCAGRCGEGFSAGEDKMCLCDLDCRHFGDCCPDYMELCGESWHEDSKRERRPIVTETSCSNRCFSNSSISATSCDCSQNCSRLGTCCSDFADKCENSAPRAPPDPARQAVPPAPYECRPSGNTGTFHWMVASCPATWRNSDISSQCGKIQLVSATKGFTGVNLTLPDAVYITPVVDVDTLTTYSNVFCAICNEASHMLESWRLSVQLSCSNVTSPNRYSLESLRDGLCEVLLFYFTPPDLYGARRCVPTYPVSLSPTCPADPSNGLVAHVHSSVHMSFLNVFSALCHGVHVSDLDCGLPAAHFPHGNNNAQELDQSTLFLGQLFNFGSLVRGPDRPTDDVPRCPSDSFYDPIIDACRELYRAPPNLMHPNEPYDWCRNGSLLYNMSQVSVLPSGEALLLDGSDNLTCNATEYLIVENQAYVCTSCLSRYADDGDGDDKGKGGGFAVQELLTTAMFSLSIAAGIGFTAHGVYYRKFSSTPDRLKLQLVLMLTLAECLFLSRALLTLHTLQRLCTAVAILLHYCLLVTFLSMSSLAFDLFRKLCCAQFSSYGVPYRRYAVFSFGLPLILVSVCAFLDFSPWTEAVRVLYGGGHCWIDNPWASLLAFGVVVGLVVLSNAYFLVWIVVSLYRSTRETSAARTGSEFALMRVCLRITTMMGLTWALGLLAPFVDNTAIWFIFTGLNSVQGLLIVIALTVKNCKTCGTKAALSETGKGSLQGSSEKGRLYHVAVRQEGCPNIGDNVTKL
ncbi:PRG4 [Branchiostoma lanceolatum]|uniref:PRG4 protein n=1 Tax=Branchiostoma lanceolatum TaxID=7740 RepID=A0A8K0EJZ1_BRALA|nr:PRG4 [Branchiostoma lanceolatum]